MGVRATLSEARAQARAAHAKAVHARAVATIQKDVAPRLARAAVQQTHEDLTAGRLQARLEAHTKQALDGGLEAEEALLSAVGALLVGQAVDMGAALREAAAQTERESSVHEGIAEGIYRTARAVEAALDHDEPPPSA